MLSGWMVNTLTCKACRMPSITCPTWLIPPSRRMRAISLSTRTLKEAACWLGLYMSVFGIRMARGQRRSVWQRRLNATPQDIYAAPRITPDGKYLFFEKYLPATDQADIYWVSTEIFADL